MPSGRLFLHVFVSVLVIMVVIVIIKRLVGKRNIPFISAVANEV